MSDYPEHDKLEKVSDKSQAIGEFLDWLSGPPHGIVLATYHRHSQLCYEDGGWPVCGYTEHGLQSAGIRFEKLLADYFEIDPNLLDKEKRAMLDEFRKATA
jgi:hypothetical protein